MEYTIQQLQEMEHEELCSLVQQQKITWSQWVEAQPELYEGYDEWLDRQGLERSDENALLYAHQVEEKDLEGQVSDDMNERFRLVADARAAMKA